MKYILKQKVIVNNFLTNNSQLFIIQTIGNVNILKCINVQNFSEEFSIQTLLGTGFQSKNNELMISDLQGNLHIYNVESKNNSNYYQTSMACLINNGVIYFDRNEKQTLRSDFNLGVIWQNPERLGHINFIWNSLLFTNKFLQKSDFYCFDINYGNFLWQVSFNLEISQIIGIFDNQLIISLSNQTLIGIEVATGEILWEFAKPLEIRADFSRNAHLDPEMGKIHFLTFYDFAEFDIQTQGIGKHKSFWAGNHQTNWQFGHSCRQGDYIYFTAGIGTAQFYYWLGVFHIPSMEIVWQYQREDKKETFNSMPQVCDNKLFALDSGGTLHIFEREFENSVLF